jgi:hypothetical protein
VTPGDFGQEHGHGQGIDLGGDQGVEPTVLGANGGEDVGVLAHDAGANLGADAAHRPAAPGIIDASEPRLVLEHQAQGSSGDAALLNGLGEFF